MESVLVWFLWYRSVLGVCLSLQCMLHGLCCHNGHIVLSEWSHCVVRMVTLRCTCQAYDVACFQHRPWSDKFKCLHSGVVSVTNACVVLLISSQVPRPHTHDVEPLIHQVAPL